ncbi:MAG: ribosome silencing factor [Bacteroidaceae bacterium]|nr:ribosome silencing factor [Candidatus Equimonas faecalis]MCQ2206124.1 ribosome silencing factor [Bacteroidaceae bacterium]
MASTQEIINALVEGLQEKKGRRICVADLSRFDTAPARAFVICSGGSPQQVDALADSAEEFCRKQLGEKPAAVAGRNNAQWVAMDFGDVILHIFLTEARDYYDLEHLWDDAELTTYPDVD